MVQEVASAKPAAATPVLLKLLEDVTPGALNDTVEMVVPEPTGAMSLT